MSYDVNKQHCLCQAQGKIIHGCPIKKVVKLTWLHQYREFKNGIAVDDTIARIISALVPEEFTSCFINWMNELKRFAIYMTLYFPSFI